MNGTDSSSVMIARMGRASMRMNRPEAAPTTSRHDLIFDSTRFEDEGGMGSLRKGLEERSG